MSNPLLAPHRFPRFDRIGASDLLPALEQVLAENERLIEAAARAPVCWDNLVRPLEAASDRLARVWGPVRHLHAVADNEALREAYGQGLTRLSAYYSRLGQHRGLYEAYRRLADSPEASRWTRAQQESVSQALRAFRLSGVELPEDRRQRLTEIDARLSDLSNRFSQNVMDATEAFAPQVALERLEGLPESVRARAVAEGQARQAAGPVLPLDGPTYQAVLTHARDRSLREEFFTAWNTRASDQGPDAGRFDNGPLMAEILALRHEKAALLGFSSWAERQLTERMADSVTTVTDFLQDLSTRSLPQARAELAELQAHGRDELGLDALEPWDVPYVAEQLRQQRFDVSQETLRPYFPAPRVVTGMFEIVRRLFGVTVEPMTGVPVWHPDVQLFRVCSGEQTLGYFYLDLYARRHKRGGAWMDGWIGRRRTAGGLQLPVAFLTCNFEAPVGDGPALLTHDEVTTLFHEFGHGLHHLLTRVDVADVAGINGVAWDAVELPSQFLENWCWQPEALALISAHHETGEALPADLLERMLAARNFQAAMMMVRQLEFALFDFDLHAGPPPADVHGVIETVRSRVAVLPQPPWHRFENGFGHIFAGGYAAGYYSYKWAEVLSADAFSRFEEEGIFSDAAGRDFLHHILERGGSEPPAELFRRFRGRDPEVSALLRHSGIDVGAAA